jgi:hypothetical protein
MNPLPLTVVVTVHYYLAVDGLADELHSTGTSSLT